MSSLPSLFPHPPTPHPPITFYTSWFQADLTSFLGSLLLLDVIPTLTTPQGTDCEGKLFSLCLGPQALVELSSPAHWSHHGIGYINPDPIWLDCFHYCGPRTQCSDKWHPLTDWWMFGWIISYKELVWGGRCIVLAWNNPTGSPLTSHQWTEWDYIMNENLRAVMENTGLVPDTQNDREDFV